MQNNLINTGINTGDSSLAKAAKEKPIYTYDWNGVHKKSFALEKEVKDAMLAKPHLKSAGLDAIGFLETYYHASTPKSLDTQFFCKGSIIGFIIRSNLENKAVGNIEFYGQGHWGYTITASKNNSEDELRGKLTYQFKGRADRWSVTDMLDDTPYLFSFYGEGAKLFDLPETFTKNYEPMLMLKGKESRSHGLKIQWKWVTSYYDGPIAGYCLYGGKLHAYEQIEEKDFSRQRLYAVYRLSMMEKLEIYIEKGVSAIMLKTLGYEVWRTAWYKHFSKIFKKSSKKWKTIKPIGYFCG